MDEPRPSLEALKRLADDPSVIVVDFYGQMLYLDVQSPEALGQLRGVFLDLAEGRARKVSLRDAGWAAFTSRLHDVVLKLMDARQEPSRTVEVRGAAQAAPSVVWTRHTEGWLECAELLDGLTAGHHQYLNSGTMDDADIEVTFGEAGSQHRFWYLKE